MLALPVFEETYTCREIADGLLETQRVEYLEKDVLLFVPPGGLTHMRIVEQINDCFRVSPVPDGYDRPWQLASENFQWELGDGTERFAVPDLTVAFPGAVTRSEFRENIALMVEVTSPGCPASVENDLVTKPKLYAEAGVPFYLLIDQKEGTWTLHELWDDWPGYRIHSIGHYGEPIELPRPFDFSIPTDQWPGYSEDGE